MARRDRGHRVRFDARSEAFSGIAANYRAALDKAEKLWRRLAKPHVARDPKKTDKVRRELAELDTKLDAAREALLGHTRKHASDPRQTRRTSKTRTTEHLASIQGASHAEHH